ncbi:MAG: PspC domain-containing protein [Bacteroidaceae bacterium]|nr:PspC domain-containing protein [Bacteroidaceae bacterium]
MGKLYRSSDRKIAGVCAGLAECFGLSVGLVRLAMLILLLVGPGLIAYIILWVIMPEKNAGKSYAERMKNRLENR